MIFSQKIYLYKESERDLALGTKTFPFGRKLPKNIMFI